MMLAVGLSMVNVLIILASWRLARGVRRLCAKTQAEAQQALVQAEAKEAALRQSICERDTLMRALAVLGWQATLTWDGAALHAEMKQTTPMTALLETLPKAALN